MEKYCELYDTKQERIASLQKSIARFKEEKEQALRQYNTLLELQAEHEMTLRKVIMGECI